MQIMNSNSPAVKRHARVYQTYLFGKGCFSDLWPKWAPTKISGMAISQQIIKCIIKFHQFTDNKSIPSEHI
jgi:hypothetical protein